MAVDGVFFKRLWSLLKICIPSLAAPEFSMVLLHTTFLVLRTWLSVLVANLDGRLVKNLVTGDGKGFMRGLGLWFALAVPATFTNSMVRPAGASPSTPPRIGTLTRCFALRSSTCRANCR